MPIHRWILVTDFLKNMFVLCGVDLSVWNSFVDFLISPTLLYWRFIVKILCSQTKRNKVETLILLAGLVSCHKARVVCTGLFLTPIYNSAQPLTKAVLRTLCCSCNVNATLENPRWVRGSDSRLCFSSLCMVSFPPRFLLRGTGRGCSP